MSPTVFVNEILFVCCRSPRTPLWTRINPDEIKKDVIHRQSTMKPVFLLRGILPRESPKSIKKTGFMGFGLRMTFFLVSSGFIRPDHSDQDSDIPGWFFINIECQRGENKLESWVKTQKHQYNTVCHELSWVHDSASVIKKFLYSTQELKYSLESWERDLLSQLRHRYSRANRFCFQERKTLPNLPES